MNPADILDREWKAIYSQLYAFALQLIEGYNWFRRTGDDLVVHGKGPEDYAMEVIAKFLENPQKYESSKRTLVSYLKKHILRNLIRADANCSENQTTVDLTERHYSDEEEEGVHQFEDLIPGLAPHFPDEIDFKAIIADLRLELGVDTEALLIFEAVGNHKVPRRDVIAEQHWTDAVYDNAMKRLNRARAKIVNKYKIGERK